jgi:hypothetical protein
MKGNCNKEKVTFKYPYIIDAMYHFFSPYVCCKFRIENADRITVGKCCFRDGLQLPFTYFDIVVVKVLTLS